MKLKSKILDEYEIESKISEGSFGVVYKVFKKSQKKKNSRKYFALKELVNLEKNKDIISREIKIHSSFNHPNIVKIFHHESTLSHVYILMEFCEMNLNQLIKKIQYPIINNNVK